MLRSLVGSEMCIRDRDVFFLCFLSFLCFFEELFRSGLRLRCLRFFLFLSFSSEDELEDLSELELRWRRRGLSSLPIAAAPSPPYSALIPVSYTHLTLPTKRIV
eukprot:TRINITY_DN3665_c0_g1_i2.p2 TRINITY_DN3665_c0_g1~~TRINITY_DN3665_c0_g1_i2.p2  ORF type:complete len:104 (+),score=28.87 TRINITY_DN3665_c0_g1_i2:162-473(+)